MRRSRLVAAAAAGVAMLMLLVVQPDLVGLVPSRFQMLAELSVGVLAGVLGAAAIYWGAGVVFRNLDGEAGVLTRNLTTWILYIVLGLGIASALGVNLSALLLGGAIAGVVVVAAAQSSLSNFFAGLVLMIARPLHVGSAVHLRCSDLGGADPQGTVVDVDSFYTTLAGPGGEIVKVPNHSVMSAMLTLGSAPVQAEVDVQLPADTELGPLADTLASRLGATDCTVTIRPHLLEHEQGRLHCRIGVRSRSVIEPALLGQALSASLVVAAAAPGRAS